MKKFLLALTLLLMPSLAQAQCTGVFPSATVCGNPTGPSGIPGPLPLSSFALSPGGSSGNIQYNNAGGFGGLTDSQVYNRISPFLIPTPPGGRLTLVSGQSVQNTDIIGGQNLYYAPDVSQTVPVLVSGTMLNEQFTSSNTDLVGLTLALGGNAAWTAATNFDVFAYWTGSAVALATRLWDSAMLPTNPQITNNVVITTGTTPTAWTRASAAFDGTLIKNGAASATLTANANLANCLGQDWGVGNTNIVTSLTITAPTDHFIYGNTAALDLRSYGSSDGTNFYLLSVNWINDAAMGASYSLPILLGNQVPYRYYRTCIDGAAGGVNNIYVAQLQYFTTTAASTRRLVKFGGVLTNDALITGALTTGAGTTNLALNTGTYLGTCRTDTSTAGQVTVYASESYGPSRIVNCWNAYNQRPIVALAGITADTATSYTLTNQIFSPCESSAFSISYVTGMPWEPVVAKQVRAVVLSTQAGNAAAAYDAGIGLDTTSALSSTDTGNNIDAPTSGAGAVIGFTLPLDFTVPAATYGAHTLTCLERAGNGAAGGSVGVFSGYRETYLKAQWRW
jgi:hypothetical protein